MSDVRIRSQIALLAARLMYSREESEYFTAKRKAARQLGVEYRYHPGDLPSNAEIREQIGALAMLYEGDRRQENLLDMRGIQRNHRFLQQHALLTGRRPVSRWSFSKASIMKIEFVRKILSQGCHTIQRSKNYVTNTF